MPVVAWVIARARSRGATALENHYGFLRWLIPVLEQFPRSQKFLLGDRLQQCALDVLDALVEASYNRRPDAALSRANLALEKLRLLLRLAHDLRHLDLRRYEFAVRTLDETGRLLGGWRRALGRQKGGGNSDGEAPPAPV